MLIFFRWRVPFYNCCQGQEENNVFVHPTLSWVFLGGWGEGAWDRGTNRLGKARSSKNEKR